MSEQPISVFDNVRVRTTPLTEQAGLAGRTGQVYGVTSPSVTGIEVIGDQTNDVAYNVAFPDRGDYWFARELIEFVDHAAGTEIGIAGKKWAINGSGEWIEQPAGASPVKKPWWMFW